MTHIKFLTGILSLCIIFACNNNKTGTGEKIELKPNFKAGESYSLDYKLNMTQEVMGLKNIIDIRFLYKMNIKSISAQKDLEINMLFDKISMKMLSPVFSISYNSDSTIVPPSDSTSAKANPVYAISRVFGSMLGKSITIILDQSGKVKEMRGYKEMINAIGDSSGSEQMNNEAMSKIMNEDQMRQLIQQSFGLYPAKPVGVGDKWEGDLNINQNGVPIHSKIIYKVAEINPVENEIQLDVDGTIKSNPDSSMKVNGVSMKLEIKGTQEGKMTADTRTGFIKEGTITQDLKAQMEVFGQKMPLNMKNIITIFGKKL